MAKALMALFEKKLGGKKSMPPRFSSEGEPEEAEARGGSPGEELDAEEAEAEERGEPEHGEGEEEGGDRSYAQHFELAVDDIADIAGISPEDRADFGSALKAAIHATIADADSMGGDEEEPEGEPPPEE